MILNQEKDELLIFSDCFNDRHFGILNLKSLEWEITQNMSKINYPKHVKLPKFVQLSHSNGHYHGIGEISQQAAHIEYNHKSMQFIQHDGLSMEVSLCNEGCAILYLEESNKLLAISNRQNTLFACATYQNQVSYAWTAFVKVPTDINMIKCHQAVSVFEGRYIVLFIIAAAERESGTKLAQILMLRVSDKTWIRCDDKIEIPNAWHCDTLKHKNLVHFIDAGKPTHFALDLEKMIPKEIIWKYAKEKEIVITGFIRTCGDLMIPKDIVLILTSFYVDPFL